MDKQVQKFDRNSVPTSGRRTCLDRRTLSAKTFFYSIFKGRRREPQRDEERNKFFYKDIYDVKLLVIVLLIVSLSVTDAALTLLILRKGGIELNPVMIWALESSSHTFFATKYLLTVVGLLTVVVHINFRMFRRVSMPRFLAGLLGFYALLVGYEFTLLAA